MALWVRFEEEIDVDKLANAALDHGVVVRSGRQFSPNDQPVNALRLGFASLDRDEIQQATQRLAQAMNTVGRR